MFSQNILGPLVKRQQSKQIGPKWLVQNGTLVKLDMGVKGNLCPILLIKWHFGQVGHGGWGEIFDQFFRSREWWLLVMFLMVLKLPWAISCGFGFDYCTFPKLLKFLKRKYKEWPQWSLSHHSLSNGTKSVVGVLWFERFQHNKRTNNLH